jgi:hypothetical protein
MTFWSGYRRPVREAGLCHKIFVPRLRCRGCGITHVLLPCFVLAGRLDVAETIGTVLEEVVDGLSGVRPAATRVDVFHSTARNWLRRFFDRAVRIGVSFAALCVELGGEAIAPFAEPARYAISAIRAAFAAASALPGWASIGTVALRLFGERRREADRHQHRFPLPRRRQTAFHASGPIVMRRTEQ